MSETIVSPGVVLNENDQSFITTQPIEAGAAIIGPTVKGPVEKPTIVTSYSDYVNRFGTTFTSGSQVYSYFTSISAYNYFENGGTTLLVTRVTSGSFTPATSTAIFNELESGVIDNITATSSLSLNSFNITSSLGNGPSGDQETIQSSTSGAGIGASITASFATSESIATIIFGGGTGYEIGDTITFSSQSLGSDQAGGTDLIITLTAANILNQSAFTLETLSEGEIMNSFSNELSDGSLESGSIDNLRWQITAPNTSSGTFTLLIRRGNDETISPVVLETWNNLSLDPLASNYIEKVIGNQKENLTSDGSDYYLELTGSFPNNSRYVRVKNVNYKTPNYLDNAGDPKIEYTAFIPIVGSGSFSGAEGSNIPTGTAGRYYQNINSTNTQGLIGSDYNDVINLLANKDEYVFKYITAPGLYDEDYATQVSSLISKCRERGDTMAIIDLRTYNSNISSVVGEAAGFNNSYAATYWPWLQTIDPNSGEQVWVPASTMMPGVYAFTDSSTEPWFAPAGTNRGVLSTVIRAERKLTQGNRDTLYEGNVNPIATFPNNGVVVFGQKTLQKKRSALDRVNVRRLLIELKSFIGQVADTLVFEQNTIATRNEFLTQVNPYLSSVQQREGLTDFRVIMDESNNTPDVIDNNKLVGQVFIQPTRTVEFIQIDFTITPTGATFE
jgi:uncharacterized protein